MRSSQILPVLFFGLILVWVVPALAAPPDAGQLLNRQRQPEPRLPQRLPVETGPEAEMAPPADAGVTVTIKAFVFRGAEGLATESELQLLVRDNIGKALDFFALQALAERITAYLREQKGYLLARAYLPSQDITDGVVEIAVIAGRIDGNVRIRVSEPRRISQDLLERLVQGAVNRGQALRLEDLERAVLLVNDLPGVSSRAMLEPGARTGTTRVGIDVSEGPIFGGLISGDNYGDRYTGTWRGTGVVTASDPFGWGDQIHFSFAGAEHMAQGSIGYAVPLGASGLTWSASYTELYYELGEDLASLDAEGRGDTLATGLAYPLVRTRKASLRGELGFEYSDLRDELGGVVISSRQIPVGKLSFLGSRFDTLGGGGLSSASLAIYYGHLDLTDVASALATDAAGPRRAGTFSRATYSLARLQRITADLSLFGSLRGQVASDNLDSSQKFILGGPTGVRAYPVGEASGDEGHAMTVETRYDLPTALEGHAAQLVGFFDTGWIRLYKDPWPAAVATATGRNNYWLSGAGVGVSVSKENRYSLRASYAFKLGDNPGRTTAGNDADNLDNNGRFWVQAVVWF